MFAIIYKPFAFACFNSGMALFNKRKKTIVPIWELSLVGRWNNVRIVRKCSFPPSVSHVRKILLLTGWKSCYGLGDHQQFWRLEERFPNCPNGNVWEYSEVFSTWLHPILHAGKACGATWSTAHVYKRRSDGGTKTRFKDQQLCRYGSKRRWWRVGVNVIQHDTICPVRHDTPRSDISIKACWPRSRLVNLEKSILDGTTSFVIAFEKDNPGSSLSIRQGIRVECVRKDYFVFQRILTNLRTFWPCPFNPNFWWFVYCVIPASAFRPPDFSVPTRTFERFLVVKTGHYFFCCRLFSSQNSQCNKRQNKKSGDPALLEKQKCIPSVNRFWTSYVK